MSQISKSLLATLSALADQGLAEEGITPDVLDAVMLDIAHTPVIAIRGEGIERAVEAIPTMGGGYIVRHPAYTQPVSAETLKVMRARYLLRNGERMQQQMAGLFASLKN